MGTLLLIAFYGIAVVLFDAVLGAVVSLNVSGQTSAPKADIYGWAIEPNHEVTIVHPDTLEATVERVNSQGWRDVEHQREKTRPRVLLLGDSQVFGHGNTLAYFDLPGLDLGPYAEVLGGHHHLAISIERPQWEAARARLEAAGVETAHVDGSSLYFRGPDGERLELISDPLREMYGKPVG